MAEYKPRELKNEQFAVLTHMARASPIYAMILMSFFNSEKPGLKVAIQRAFLGDSSYEFSVQPVKNFDEGKTWSNHVIRE